jgi:hypothetical protein
LKKWTPAPVNLDLDNKKELKEEKTRKTSGWSTTNFVEFFQA